jgi:hypothetical protein
MLSPNVQGMAALIPVSIKITLSLLKTTLLHLAGPRTSQARRYYLTTLQGIHKCSNLILIRIMPGNYVQK